MIKKVIYFVFVISFLIGVCVWEEIAVHQYLGQIDKAVTDIYLSIEQNPSIDSSDMLLKVESMQDIWKQKANKFCVILNHQQVEDIGVEIARLKGAIINNDKQELLASITVIRFYVDNLNQILGLSVQNLL
jgi:hypothetical protein